MADCSYHIRYSFSVIIIRHWIRLLFLNSSMNFNRKKKTNWIKLLDLQFTLKNTIQLMTIANLPSICQHYLFSNSSLVFIYYFLFFLFVYSYLFSTPFANIERLQKQMKNISKWIKYRKINWINKNRKHNKFNMQKSWNGSKKKKKTTCSFCLFLIVPIIIFNVLTVWGDVTD